MSVEESEDSQKASKMPGSRSSTVAPAEALTTGAPPTVSRDRFSPLFVAALVAIGSILLGSYLHFRVFNFKRTPPTVETDCGPVAGSYVRLEAFDHYDKPKPRVPRKEKIDANVYIFKVRG